MDALKPRERLLGPALRTQPDRRLVALARDGSTRAQEEIVRRYRAALVRFAGSIVGPAAAEDVVQEALTKGLAALGDADQELRLRPWLYTIVRNTALNHLRDAGPATEQLDENYDGVEQPPQALERRERVRSLVGGLRGLPRASSARRWSSASWRAQPRRDRGRARRLARRRPPADLPGP